LAAYGDLTGQFLLAVFATNVNSAGAVCDQKIPVFVLQMGKFNQRTWMGWGYIALLRERDLPILPGGKKKE
jgi:hypothetical protein